MLTSLLAEDLDEQVGGSVRDERLIGEVESEFTMTSNLTMRST